MKTTTIFEAYKKARYDYLYRNDKPIEWYIKLRRQAIVFHDAILDRCKLLDYMLEMQQIKKELP